MRFPEHWTIAQIIEHIVKQILANQEKQMSALTDLQASVAKLQADVDTLISSGASDADLVALKTTVDAIDAKVAPPAPTA